MTPFIRSALLAATTLVSAVPAALADVNIYSFNQSERMQPLFDAFTEETGIPVNVVFVNTGLIARMKAEGARSPADVVMTVDIARLKAVADADLLQPVKSDKLDKAIPAQFRDPNGLWYGMTTRARIVYASKERVEPGAVTTYEDLADPKWKGRVCSRSGLSDYNLALTAAMIAHHGADYTKTWLEGLKANLARKPQGNDRAQAKAIWAGECDIALGNTYYIGQMLKNPEEKEYAEAVRLDFPVFEGGGTHVNISGIAMTKSSPNPDAAVALMEFLASPEGQRIYGEINSEFPLREGVKVDPVMADWPDFTPDNIDLLKIAEERPLALKLTEEVDFDG
ncbi:MAG: Fe(3+) ABC transporter substrate-binding protein [Paracoccaceae bacterium]